MKPDRVLTQGAVHAIYDKTVSWDCNKLWSNTSHDNPPDQELSTFAWPCVRQSCGTHHSPSTTHTFQYLPYIYKGQFYIVRRCSTQKFSTKCVQIRWWWGGGRLNYWSFFFRDSLSLRQIFFFYNQHKITDFHTFCMQKHQTISHTGEGDLGLYCLHV
jgi:hypothetical protein